MLKVQRELVDHEKVRTLMNVGEDTPLGDGNVAKQLVQLLIVPDGELEVSGDDAGLLVVAGSVASQFEDFSGKILQHSRQVDRGTGTDTLSVVTLAQETMDTTDRERETGLR